MNHIPNTSFSRQVIDKHRVQRRFEKALSTYDQNATAQQQINRRLIAMLTEYLNHQGIKEKKRKHIIEIGCGTGDLSRLLATSVTADAWLFNDLSPKCSETLSTLITADNKTINAKFMASDAEIIHTEVAANSCDLLVSASAIQWFNNPLSFIDQSTILLQANGLLLFSTFIPDNLLEINRLLGTGLDYPTLSEWQEKLSNNFEIISLDTTTITVEFESPQAVLKHLKNTGVTTDHKSTINRSKLKQFYTNYKKQYATSNGVQLTYAPLLILAKRL